MRNYGASVERTTERRSRKTARPNLLAVSLPSTAFITLRAQQENRHATLATQLPLKNIEERDPFFSERRGHLDTGYVYSFSKSNWWINAAF